MALHQTRTDDASEQRRPSQSPATGERSPFLGTWYNTNRASGGIVEAVVTWRDERVWLRIFGAADDGGKQDLGEVEAELFLTNNPGSYEDEGLLAEYDFGFMTTLVAANQKRGILVLECFNRFRDDSGRADYFAREFYHRIDGAEDG